MFLGILKMVRFDSGSKDYMISFKITQANATNIITIIDADPTPLRAKHPSLPTDAIVNAYLTELFATCVINSLPEINIPDYQDEDSRTQRLTKTLSMQWTSPRLHLNFYTCAKSIISSPSDWNFVGAESLINTAGYPYERKRPSDFLTENLARALGDTGKIGVSVADVGSGYLTSIDEITIDGSWKHEYTVMQPDFSPVIVQGTVQQISSYTDTNTRALGSVSTQVLAARSKRTTSSIKNNSGTATVYIGYTSPVSATSNDGTIAPGATRILIQADERPVYAINSTTGGNITTSESWTA